MTICSRLRNTVFKEHILKDGPYRPQSKINTTKDPFCGAPNGFTILVVRLILINLSNKAMRPS